MSWISSLLGHMGPRAAQESSIVTLGEDATSQRHKRLVLFFLFRNMAEMHPSNWDNPPVTFFYCTGSSFTSICPPILLKLKAVFKLKQYHMQIILTVSAWLKSHLFSEVRALRTSYAPNADNTECLSAKAISWTLTSLISHLSIWLFLSVPATAYTNWRICARNALTNS